MSPLTKKHRQDADTPWKNILDLYFRQFMELCLPHIAEKLDWTKGYEILDKEFTAVVRGAKIRKKLADKLMKAWLKEGQETWILLHLEAQGRKEDEFSERMFVYRYRLRDLYQKPIISIAILVDGNPNWRPDHYKECYLGCSIEMRYCLIKILDFAQRRSELETMDNPFAMVILAQLAVLEASKQPQARLLTKISLTRQLYQRGWGKKDIFQLLTFIDWLLVLPESLMLEYRHQIQQIEEEKQMRQTRYITSFERYGRKIGREEGIEKGREEGKQTGVADVILRLLQRKFGVIPENYIEHIRKSNLESLLVIEERILDAKELNEIFD